MLGLKDSTPPFMPPTIPIATAAFSPIDFALSKRDGSSLDSCLAGSVEGADPVELLLIVIGLDMVK